MLEPPVAVAAADPGKPPADYLQRLVQLIPAEFTAAYLALTSLLFPIDKIPGVPGLSRMEWLLVAFFFALLITLPFYLWRVQKITRPTRILVTTISFPIWALSVSAATVADHTGLPPQVFGAVLLFWTTLLPVFVP